MHLATIVFNGTIHIQRNHISEISEEIFENSLSVNRPLGCIHTQRLLVSVMA